MITRTFKLCLNAGTGSAPYINVSQYDEGETWLFELYSETGERYIPSTGAIVGVKSDGHGIINTGTVDNEGRVVITETQQMTASAGRAIFELSIDGLTHGTANFIVAVERKPTDEAVMSDSDLSLIQQAVDSAEVIVEVIGDGDPSEVIGEHVDAWLDAHPEATTTVEDGAITAPKINQSLWDKLLVSEEASGAVASFDDGADDVPVSSLKVNLEPIQTGTGDPSPSNVRPIVASNGKNLLNIHDASGWTIPSGGELSVSGETVSMKILASGSTRYTLNQHLEGNKTVAITFTSSKAYGRIFVALRKMDDSGWMTNSDASIEGMTYNQYYDGWFTYFSGASASQTITIPNCLYWQFGLGYGNNGVVIGETEAIYNPMIRPVSITDSSYQPYQGIMVDVVGKNLIDESGLPKTVSGSNHISFPLPSWAYERGRSEEVTLSLKGSLGEGKTQFALYIYDTVNNNALYIGNSQYLTAANNFTLKGKIIVGGGGGTDPTKPLTIRIYAQPYDGSVTSTISGLMLAFGDTEYEPYKGASYPYTLGQSVYGGSVDLSTGVLKVDRAINVLDGTQSMDDNGALSYGGKQVAYTPSPAKEMSIADGLLCDRFSNSVSSAVEGHIAGRTTNANLYFNMPASCTTLQLVKDWFAENPTQVVYPLANPTTVQLTPQEVKTLLGYNNISSTGTVDVIYHADTKLYVDKMTAVDNNIIAPTEADFVATRNYTVNDLVIVNDTLYKVTANIASGSTITPNSNVTQTTLGALIKALS